MYPKSTMNLAIHIATFIACVLAMYLAFVVDNAIVNYHLLFQEINPPPTMNIKIVYPTNIAIFNHLLGL
jgi:hypothetical protein